MSKNQYTNTPGQESKQPGTTSADALARVDELVKRRGEINDRISDIQSEKNRIFTKRHNLQKTIFNLQDHLRGMPDDDQRHAAARQELTDKLFQARAEHAQNEDYQKQLDKEIEQLKFIELPACVVAVCAGDVMEHQQRVTQAALVVNNIQAAIDAQNQSIAEAKATIPLGTNRQQERHSLLADLALGNATDADLKKLDSVIAKEQLVVAEAMKQSAPLIENVKATVSGLERKLAAAQEELQNLELKSKEVAHRYYMGEAEKIAIQYVNAAMHLKELHLRLLGLDLIINKHDGSGIKCHGAKQIQIPMFKLPQFEGLGNPSIGDWTLLDGEKIYGDDAAQAAGAEKARFDAILDGHYYQ